MKAGRFRDDLDMSESDGIREWLRAKLDHAPRGTRAQLAKTLGVSADAITRMLNVEPGKEPRKISAVEYLQMQVFFSNLTGAPLENTSLLREQAIKVLDELPADLQLVFAKQLAALEELAKTRRS